MTMYLRISGLCFSLAVIVSLLGFVAAFAEIQAPEDIRKTAPQEIIAPSDGQKVVALLEVEKIIGPTEVEKVIAPKSKK